jgi:AraC family transcriptional regulator
MVALATGTSTGTILRSFRNNGLIINTTEYSSEECRFGMHYHENPHLCFLLQGTDTESRKNATYSRKAGEVFFYHAGEEHASTSRSAITKNTIIEFEQSFFVQYGIKEEYLERVVKSHPDVKFLILKMQKELLFNDSSTAAALESLVLHFATFANDSPAKPTPHWVRNLEAILREQWNEPLSLEELSLAIGIHPVTISKHFRRYFFCTLGEYLRKLKVEKSIALIKNSELPLTEIAYLCGFSDQSHFTKVFKETLGFLPKEFRHS